MELQLNCSLCSQQYSQINPPRLITICNHNYCHKCLKKLIKKTSDGKYKIQCPKDQNTMVIQTKNPKIFSKNMELLTVIIKNKHDQKEQQAALQNQFLFDQKSMDTSYLYKHKKKSVNSLKNKKQLTSEENCNKIEKCVKHKKILDIVCTDDLIQICSDCALFGQHRGHTIQSLVEVEKNCEIIVNDIQQIINKKQQIQKKMGNQEIYTQIINLLEGKRNQLNSQINKMINRIKDNLIRIQKILKNQLENCIIQCQTKLKTIIQINGSTSFKYIQWQIRALQQLKIFQSNNKFNKLQLLLKQDTIKIINNGNNILKDMKYQQNNLIESVQKILNNLKFHYDQILIQKLNQFASINIKEQFNQNQDVLLVQQQFQNSNLFLEHSIIQPNENHHIEIKINSQFQNNLNHFEQNRSILNRSIIQQKSYIKQKNTNRKTNYSKCRTMSSNFISLGSKIGIKSNNIRFKLPQKYDKIILGIINDTIEIVDLSNAELNDDNIQELMQLINKCNKIKTLKLFKNKFTDQSINKILPYCTKIIKLNLAQNSFTSEILQILIQMKQQLPLLKSIVLCQNKIIQRKQKQKIQFLKKMNIVVTL